MTSAKRFLSRFSRYADLMAWVMRDSTLRFRRPALIGLACSFGALLLQIASLAIVATYAHLLEQGDEVLLLGQPVQPRESPWLLTVAGAGALVLLLLSALLTLAAGRASVRLRREYQVFCTERALRTIETGLPILAVRDRRGRGPGGALRLIRGDSGYAGWVAQLGLEAVLPAIAAAGALAILLLLEPVLTLVVAVIVLLSVTSLMKVSIRAARASVRMEATSGEATEEVRACVVATREGHSTESSLMPDGPFHAHFAARDVRMNALHSSRFISNLFLSVALFIVIVTLGVSILREGAGWGRLLIYLAVCRHSLYSLRSVTQLLTSINRFYPHLHRYREFVDPRGHRSEGAAPDRWRIRPEKSAISGSLPVIELRAPASLCVLTALQLNRFTAGAIVLALVGHDRVAAAAILRSARLVSADGNEGGRAESPDRIVLRAGDDRDQRFFTILVTDDPAAAMAPGPEFVAVVHGGRVVALGDPNWITERRDEIVRLLDAPRGRDRNQPDDNQWEDFEDV